MACPNSHCFAAQGAGCAQGHMSLTNCPTWTSAAPAATEVVTTQGDDIALPWSGEAMGIYDLGFVSGRAKPITVGIVGPESAGKTTILGAWYLLLGRGTLIDVDQFACSYTLNGWEAVASSLRWEPGHKPSFPPHTSSRGARAKGLLHLGFRHQNGLLRDYVFADAPGEWFSKWAVNANSDDAEGARWIAQHSDVSLLVADRQALSGSRMGSARSAFQILAKRVAVERRGRPTALVWTKADVPIDAAMEAAIRLAITKEIPDAAEFSVGVFATNGIEPIASFQKLFQWVLSARRPGIELSASKTNNHDPLFVYGTRYHG